jgi:hypothetical protein
VTRCRTVGAKPLPGMFTTLLRYASRIVTDVGDVPVLAAKSTCHSLFSVVGSHGLTAQSSGQASQVSPVSRSPFPHSATVLRGVGVGEAVKVAAAVGGGVGDGTAVAVTVGGKVVAVGGAVSVAGAVVVADGPFADVAVRVAVGAGGSVAGAVSVLEGVGGNVEVGVGVLVGGTDGVGVAVTLGGMSAVEVGSVVGVALGRSAGVDEGRAVGVREALDPPPRICTSAFPPQLPARRAASRTPIVVVRALEQVSMAGSSARGAPNGAFAALDGPAGSGAPFDGAREVEAVGRGCSLTPVEAHGEE